MDERISIFISSTSKDLAEYRSKVIEVILRLEMYPIPMETFVATDRNALQLCYDKVQEADIFIGIYAHRYGYAPESDKTYRTNNGEVKSGDGETSITHLEYLWARERGIPICLFVLDTKDGQGKPLLWPLDKDYVDEEPAKSRLRAFKDLLTLNYVVNFFYSPEHLAMQVSTSLIKTIASFQDGIKRAAQWYVLHEAPSPSTGFIGRKEDLISLDALFGTLGSRVIIYAGGGTGKTSLAKKFAQEYSNKFQGGILWVSLGEKIDELDTSLLFEQWKHVTSEGRNTPLNKVTRENVKRWLRQAPNPVLVIIDDVWHKAPLEAVLELLPAFYNVLVTTRNIDHIPTPEWNIYSLKQLAPQDALAILSRHLQDPLHHSNALNEIAKFVGYHAMAINLLAAQLGIKSSTTPEKLLNRIRKTAKYGNNFFDKLSLGTQRDNNLNVVFDMSYEELSDQLKYSFRCLGVLPIDVDFGFTSLFILWGINENDEEEVEQAEEWLDELCRMSLIEVVNLGRFKVHNLLNIYALGLLQETNDELEEVTIRLNADFNRLLDLIQGLSFDEWESELGSDFGYIHGLCNHIVSWLEDSLKEIGAPDITSLSIPNATYTLGSEYDAFGLNQELFESWIEFLREGVANFIFNRGAGNDGLRWLQAGVASARLLGKHSEEGLFLKMVADWHSWLGHYQLKLAYLDKSLQIFQQLNDFESVAILLHDLGRTLSGIGQPTQAVARFEQALSVTRENGLLTLEAKTFQDLGDYYISILEHEKAINNYEQALELFHQLDYQLDEAQVLSDIAEIYKQQGSYSNALKSALKSLSLTRELSAPLQEAQQLLRVSSTYDAIGNQSEAVKYAEQSLELTTRHGLKILQAEVLITLASTIVNTNVQKAIGFIKKSLLIGEEIQFELAITTAQATLATIYYSFPEAGYKHEAIPLLEALIDRMEKNGWEYGPNRWSVAQFRYLLTLWKQGIDPRTFDFKSTSGRFRDNLSEVLQAPSWDRARQILLEHSEMLSDEFLQGMDMLIMFYRYVNKSELAMLWGRYREILKLCRVMDIEKAFERMKITQRQGAIDDSRLFILGITDSLKSSSNSEEHVQHYFRRGEAYYSLGEYTLALSDLNVVITLEPENSQAYLARGIIYRELQDFQAALSDFTHTISINPKEVNAYVNRATIHNVVGNYNAALVDVNVALSIEPNNVEGLYIRGVTYYGIGDLNKSLANVNDAIERLKQREYQSAQFEEIFSTRANIYLDLERYSDAIVDFTSAINQLKSDCDLYYGRATAYRNLKQYELAISDLDAAIVLSPSNGDYFFYRGICHYNLEQYQLALVDFNQSIKLEPEDTAYYKWRADTKIKLKTEVSTLEDYTRLIELESNVSDHYDARAEIYRGLKQWDESLNDYDKSIFLSPEKISHYLGRANTRQLAAQFNGALEDLKKTLELGLQNDLIYIARSNLFILLADYQHGLAELEKLNSQEPNELEHSNRSILLRELGNLKQALSEIDQSILINPENSLNYYWRSVLLIEFGNFPMALEDLEKSIQKDDSKNNIALVGFWRGIVEQLSSKPEKAIEIWQTAIHIALEDQPIHYGTLALLYLVTHKMIDAKANYIELMIRNNLIEYAVAHRCYLRLLSKLFPEDQLFVDLKNWFNAEIEKRIVKS